MKRFNVNECIWFLILAAFTIYLYFLYTTDKIYIYVHPKMIKFVLFALVSLGILSIVQFKKILMIHYNKNIRSGFILFIFPLILGVFINPIGLNAEIADQKGVSLPQMVQQKQSVDAANIDSNISGSVDNAQQSRGQTAEIPDAIILDAENFVQILDDVYGRMDQYKGKQVSIQGFVYKDTTLKEDQFIIGRLFMSCCAADSQVVGFIAKSNEAGSLQNDQWIEITGRFSTTEYFDPYLKENTIMPVIEVVSIQPIERLSNPYVYDYLY